MLFKHILVTGGAGYVGAVLVPKLLTGGYRVTVLDWFLYGEVMDKHQNLKLIKGDIRNKKTVSKALEGVDAVIHLACISNDPSFELDPALGKSVNLDGTKLVIDLAKGAGIRRFVYASSSSVYGVKNEMKVTEELALEPLTDYSKYKATGEKYLLGKIDPNFCGLILRPATVCGHSRRMRFDLTVNLLTINALVNKKIRVFGGSQKRPNIHIEDMTDLYLNCLTYDETQIQGKIYNAGYENFTVMEIARMVKAVVGDQSIKIVTEPTNDHRSYHINSDLIKKELAFVPKRTVKKAIRDITKAYRQELYDDPLNNHKYFNIKAMKAACKPTANDL
jgi:nucleoside-diphosphate-sugar epimerase